eukprot:11183223-Lingulodinium_polyedra.AAC.1
MARGTPLAQSSSRALRAPGPERTTSATDAPARKSRRKTWASNTVAAALAMAAAASAAWEAGACVRRRPSS